ncbi:MAG: hypothetical protein M3460_05405 [Actinomycetota bacterium]|nr:hypothetical protein [Actinomycetota bacterium]
MTSWYLRSLSDHDTHCGHLRRGRVLAACGMEFLPLRAWRKHGAALPSEPPDPDQVCLECQRIQVKTPGQGSSG